MLFQYENCKSFVNELNNYDIDEIIDFSLEKKKNNLE